MVQDQSASADDDSALFASLYGDLRRFAAVVGWPRHDPDDLVQEAVARTLRHGPLSALTNPGAYLRTAIVRQVSNTWRGRRVRRLAHSSLAAERVSGSVDSYPSDLADLDHLDPRDRAVLYLSVIEQRTFAEIGALLGISDVAARKRSSRAIARMRTALAIPLEEQ